MISIEKAVRSTDIRYDLTVEGSYAGTMHLELVEGRYQIWCVFLLPEYKGQGFGKALYEHVLQDLGTLRSDCNVNEEATRVWRSLAKKYTVRESADMYFHSEHKKWLSGDGGPCFTLELNT